GAAGLRPNAGTCVDKPLDEAEVILPRPVRRDVRIAPDLFERFRFGHLDLRLRPRRAALGQYGGRKRCRLAAVLRQLHAPMLARSVGLDQAEVEIERAFSNRRAEIDGERERIARALRMLHQRAQDRRSREAAERADEGPVIGAGASLPAAVTGGDPRGVVEEMRGFAVHSVRFTPSFRGGPIGPNYGAQLRT